MMPVTDIPTRLAHAPYMDRMRGELSYVLENLCRMRQEVIAQPGLFEPDALERTDKAIALREGFRQESEAA